MNHAHDDEMNQQLLDAAFIGDLALVEQALQNGGDVECTVLDTCTYMFPGTTPLHVACSLGHLDVVRYFLTSHDATLEATENDGYTPLHFASWRAHLDVVQELVARGANLEARTNGGGTSLHISCFDDHLDVVQELVAGGADLFIVAEDGKTAFDNAFERGQNNVVDYLLHAYADKVSAREGPQAIHSILQAATFLELENFHPPLALPAQVQLPLGNLTVDHFASLFQWFPDASFRRRDNNGALPLHIACEKGAPIEIVRPLLQRHPAALHMTNDINGDLPLHSACRAAAAAESLIRFLAEQDPNAVQAPNNDGALPLHLLCGSSRPILRTVQYLVAAFQGALAMRTHQGGDLPLMLACQASASESVLQVLLTAYPDALIYMDSFYT